ncbi:MAG: VWA domain-containing protein [Polyangiales bacterium]
MQRSTQRLTLAVCAAFGLGIVCDYALQHDSTTPRHPTRTHAAGSTTTPLMAATHPMTSDPFAADRPTPPASSTPEALTGDVKLNVQVDRTAVLQSSEGEVQVKVVLTAPSAAASQLHKPTDVMVVLDVSGSMSGDKLHYAKLALEQLIGRIAPGDRFGLMTYADDAQLVIPLGPPSRGAINRWLRQVQALETRGSTNMSAGLDLAIQQLRASAAVSGHTRVLLLSDGHANVGDSSQAGLGARARRLMAREYVLTTMGVGDDFNEDLMTALAELGTGNFYYLSRVETIGRYFDAELRASSQTVASALELRFEPAPGTIAVDMSDYEIQRGDGFFSVRPGNLYAGQERTFWVTLKVPTDQLGARSLGRFSLVYKRDQATYRVASDVLPTLTCTADQQHFEHSVDRKVWEDAVINHQFQQRQLAIGRAISDGQAAEVDREVKSYESNSVLAEKLGSSRVMDQIRALKGSGEAAKVAQEAPAPARSLRAKEAKARATFGLRSDAYNDNPLAGME